MNDTYVSLIPMPFVILALLYLSFLRINSRNSYLALYSPPSYSRGLEFVSREAFSPSLHLPSLGGLSK